MKNWYSMMGGIRSRVDATQMRNPARQLDKVMHGTSKSRFWFVHQHRNRIVEADLLSRNKVADCQARLAHAA